VERIVTCDVCGVEIVRLLDSENLENEVVSTGGCPASLHPDGLDACLQHLLKDNRVIRAVKAHINERAAERHLVRTEMDSMHLPV